MWRAPSKRAVETMSEMWRLLTPRALRDFENINHAIKILDVLSLDPLELDPDKLQRRFVLIRGPFSVCLNKLMTKADFLAGGIFPGQSRANV
jgi:hypothetical protein